MTELRCGDIIIYGKELWIVYELRTLESGVEGFRAIGYGRDEVLEDAIVSLTFTGGSRIWRSNSGGDHD